ncbi:MAG: hypothetical protein WDO69_28540 [Pseudomonadota bacterium]
MKTENQIKAGELFSEGRKLAEAGDYKQACPKFEQSMSLNFGIGVQFNLADCWEHIGRNASAQALFQGVAASARAAGQTERAQVAQARAEALEPRLVRLLIEVKATDSALVVRRNRILVEQKAWGAATPVDAGEYLIEATAPGKKPWSTRVVVPVSASEVVSIVVPQLDAAEPTKELSDAPKEAPAKPPAPPPEPKAARHSGYAYALAGLGVVSLGVGTALALSFKSKNDEAKQICPSGVDCSQSDIDRHAELISDAKGLRTGAFIGFGVGAAALIAGSVLYFTPSSSSNTAGLRAAPFVTADGTWGAVASGRF